MQSSDELAAQYHLFASIRERFAHPGNERGGCLCPRVTPVYVRKFAPHAATIFPNLQTVESSFTAEQLPVVTHSILLLKAWIAGTYGQRDLTARILEQFAYTRPSFALALLRSTEHLLADCIAAHPSYAPVFDAVFRVAGSEGFRDLIQFHGTRLLTQTANREETALPDILGFVNIHQRPSATASLREMSEQYEVWCLGHDLAKVFYQRCQAAATALIEHNQVETLATREMELRSLPIDLVRHLTDHVQQHAQQILARNGFGR